MRKSVYQYVLMILACVFVSCTEKNSSSDIRVAVPDDMCGILAAYMYRDKQQPDTQYLQETFSMKDCCSTTAEWALSSDNVDVAWLCPDAAEKLIAKDKRFKIIGPALVNSQVLVIRPGGKPKRIAYSHKREYLREFIHKRYGVDCEIIPVMPSALPYIYEQGSVDGVVIDVVKGMFLRGEYSRLADGNNDMITYVLVVSSDFLRTEKYPLFIDELKKTAGALNNTDTLSMTLEKEKNITHHKVKQIVSLGARFIPPPAY